ncbi:AI-2E family transporter [Ligilactobacillus sp. Marseille-Q7487]|uniref:AI-2E family transporter n=1 Tax=Ligilactobacillus sp. Marseille-Q7487 TaxID=3022128 RepID=UPI0024A97120|nr:AI-2E family transporter [Ligilactobacillus sp. Marseille-Q7487]
MFFTHDKKRRLMYWSLELLIVAVLIWVCTKINFVFEPIWTFFSTLFAPFLVAGFLFYLLNPVVGFLSKIKYKKFNISRNLAIAIVFILLFAVVGVAISVFVPSIITQVQELVKGIPKYVKDVQEFVASLSKQKQPSWLAQLDVQSYVKQFENTVLGMVKGFMFSLTNSIGSVISTLTSVTVTIITAPFILFYMLKDGEKLLPALKSWLPVKRIDRVESLLLQMSYTISRYIAGQAFECFFVGTCSAIGYSLVGVPYALLIGLFAGITNMIPYLGPYIGLIPALFLAFSMSLKTVILVCVVCLVVQQIDGNLIYPNVIGKSLDIHPLTIIIILLVAGNLAGLLGMILGVPLYALVKVLVKFCFDVIKVDSEAHENQE